MSLLHSRTLAMTTIFLFAGGIAVAEQCWVDVAHECCMNNHDYRQWLNSQPNCRPAIIENPWILQAVEHPGGIRNVLATTCSCKFVPRIWENGNCFPGVPNLVDLSPGFVANPAAIHCEGEPHTP